MVDSNMRRLKRIPAENGLTFTLETLQEQKKDNLLCNFCGWQEKEAGYDECEKYKKLKRYESEGIAIAVRNCDVYQPILTFRPPLGYYKGKFNTFRLGSAWYNRISVGTVCALYDTSKNEIFGKAVVEEVHHGDLEEMCEDHAHRNHLFLKTDPDEATERMLGAINKAYGHIIKQKEDPTCTVIYLKNTKKRNTRKK